VRRISQRSTEAGKGEKGLTEVNWVRVKVRRISQRSTGAGKGEKDQPEVNRAGKGVKGQPKRVNQR
jgi:hypothetical protein